MNVKTDPCQGSINKKILSHAADLAFKGVKVGGLGEFVR